MPILASRNINDLDAEISSLGIINDNQKHTFTLRDEGEVSAFWGIQISKIGDNESFLTQTGLIDKELSVTKTATSSTSACNRSISQCKGALLVVDDYSQRRNFCIQIVDIAGSEYCIINIDDSKLEEQTRIDLALNSPMLL